MRRLVVLGLEVGGRWSAEAAAFIRLLARPRARSAAVTQRAACVAAFVTRWSGLLSIAAARSFAASLLSLLISNTANLDGEAPLLSDVLADSSETPLRSPPAWGELASMLGMVRGLVVGLVDSGSLLHRDRAQMLTKRSVEKKCLALELDFTHRCCRIGP